MTDQDIDPTSAASVAAAAATEDDGIIEKAASVDNDNDKEEEEDEDTTTAAAAAAVDNATTTTTGSKSVKSVVPSTTNDDKDTTTILASASVGEEILKPATKTKALPTASSSKTKGVLSALLAEEDEDDSDSDSNSDDNDNDNKSSTTVTTGKASAIATAAAESNSSTTTAQYIRLNTNTNTTQNQGQQYVQQMEYQQRQQLLQQQLQQEQRRLMMMGGGNVPGAYYQQNDIQQQLFPYQQHGMVGMVGMQQMMMNPHNTGMMMMMSPPDGGASSSMMPPPPLAGTTTGGAATRHIVNRHQQHLQQQQGLLSSATATTMKRKVGMTTTASTTTAAIDNLTSSSPSKKKNKTIGTRDDDDDDANEEASLSSSGGLKTKSVLVDLEESSVFGGGGDDDDDDSSIASSVVVTTTAAATAAAAQTGTTGGFSTIAPRPPPQQQGALFAFNRQQTIPIPPGYHPQVVPTNLFQQQQYHHQMQQMQQMQYSPSLPLIPVGGGGGGGSPSSNVGMLYQQGIIGGAMSAATGPVIMGRGISAAVNRKSPPPSSSSKGNKNKKQLPVKAGGGGGGGGHKSDLQHNGKRGHYIKHMDPDYIKKRLHGIYKHACNEKNNYTPCIQQYCKKVYGDSFEKHRRQMNKHFTQSGLLKLLEKRLHFNNRIVTEHIKSYVESWITGELGRKRKKKEEATAAAAKAKASSIDTTEAGAGGATDTANDGSTYNLPRSVVDYARPQEEEIIEQQLTKKKRMKMQKNIVYEGRCKLTGKERVYFNHKDPRYIREHLYGIYKYGHRNNFTSNVAKYCEKAFKDEGPWEQNRYKYRTLSPHFTRSNLLVELKKETHYDSIIIQDTIDKYMNELIANKEVYIVKAAGEDDDDDDADIIVDDENNDKYPIELPLFYNEMTIEMENVMKIDDKTTRIIQLNKLSDKYDTKNWLTKKLVLEVMNACRGTFNNPSPPTPSPPAAAAETSATAGGGENAAETTTAMETAMAMAAIAATGTATSTASQEQESGNTATAAAAGSSPAQQQQQPQQPPPPESDYRLFSKSIAKLLPANRKFASLTQLHQFMKLYMSFWDVPRLVHGSGALSCHYRKRTLKRQMTPEAVERRRKSGLSKLDDYNCPFKLAYSKLRFAKNQNSRKWKPRIFHIAKVSNFNTCHNCKEFHDDKQNNYQNYDKSDVSAFADSVRSLKRTPIVINIDNGSSGDGTAASAVAAATLPIASWMYDKDAWINMTNHFFDQCCTIEEDEEFESFINNNSAMDIRRTITIHQSRSTQERKKRSSAVHTNHNNPTNKGCNVSRVDIDSFVTNFDNLDVLVQFWSEFIKRNPNEAFRTNEWGGVFDILRTICDDNIMGRSKMLETKGLLTALGSVADPLRGANIDAKNACSNFIRYLYTDDDDSDDNNNSNNNNNNSNNDHDNNNEDDEDEDDY